MNFQDRLTGTKKKTRIIYCKNSVCAVNQLLSKKHNQRTLKSINCLITDQEKDIEKQLFYICSECGYYDFSNFDRPITSESLNLQTFIIPDSFEESYSKMLKPKSSQKCLFCNLENIVSSHSEYFYKSEIEVKKREIELDISDNEKKELEKKIFNLQKTSKPIYELKPCVYRLFTKIPKRRNYLGFLCLNCKAIYYDPNFKEIEWKRILEQYNAVFEDETINPLHAWNEIYEQKLKLQKRKTPNEIEIQESETWKNFKIEEPPQEQEEISIKFLGSQHTSIGLDVERPERFSIRLDDLTLRKAVHAIKDYGSKRQKEELRQFGYL